MDTKTDDDVNGDNGQAEREEQANEALIEQKKRALMAQVDSFLSTSMEPTLISSNYDFSPAYDEQVAFTKGCKMSPDGLCLLTNASDRRLRIYEVNKSPLAACITMKEGELIYDYQWYPLMDSNDADSCALICTSQYQPVHLYDAYDGHIRATYRCFNHLDEMVSATCLAFDGRGDKFYAGLKNELRLFDLQMPGKKSLECRKIIDNKDECASQTGIISSIATNVCMNTCVYAVGTFGKSVGVYAEPRGQLLAILQGQSGGVTHLQFSPDGSKLLVGGRKDDEILIWDMRNPGKLYCLLKRKVNTNQRIYFDVRRDDKVISGGTDGSVSVWDLNKNLRNDEESVCDPIWTSDRLHDGECVNGVSFSPTDDQLFATSSGQRHISTLPDSDDEEEHSSSDCSVKLWKI